MEEYRHIAPSALTSVPIFIPEEHIPRQWLSTVDRLGRVYGWSEDQKVEVAKCRLSAAAQLWESGVSNATRTWEAFRAAFIDRYAQSDEELMQQLMLCTQGRQQSVRSYADRFRNLLAQLGLLTGDGEPDQAGANKTYKGIFMRGLQPHIRRQVFMFEPADLEAAIKKAIFISEGGQSEYGEQPAPERQVRFELPQRDTKPVDDRRPESSPASRGGPPPQSWRREDRQRPPSRPQPGPAPAPARPTVDQDTLDSLSRKLAKMALKHMEQVQPRAAVHYSERYPEDVWTHMVERLDGWAADSRQPELYAAEGDYDGDLYGDLETYMTKRQSEPEPYRASKRMDVGSVPGRAVPGYPSDRTPRRAAAPAAATAAPARQQPGGETAGANGARRAEAARQPPPAEPTRTRGPGGAATRVDPVPADAADPEAKLADEVVARVIKTPVTLGAALRINTTHVVSRVAGKLMGLARQAAAAQTATAPAAAGGTQPRAANMWDDGRGASRSVYMADSKARVNDTIWEDLALGLTDAAELPEALAAPMYHLPARLPTTPYASEATPKYQVCKCQVHLTDSEGYLMPFTGIVDSGASNSVVTLNTLRQLGLQDEVEPTSVVFLNANGARSNVHGVIRNLGVILDNLSYSLDMFVSNAHNYSLLLGSDWLLPVGATICFYSRRLIYTSDNGGRAAVCSWKT